MDPLVIERVVAFAEVLAVEHAAVERRVVFAGDRVDRARLEAARNFLEQLHARGVNVAAVSVVGEVTGEKYEIRLRRRLVEQRDRTLERFGSEGIGRALEADVRIAELREGEAGRRFTVGLFEIAADFAGLGPALEERRELIQYADSDRSPRDSEKRPSVEILHFSCPSPDL
jgi:hypothetical protein